MIINSIKTKSVKPGDNDLFTYLDSNLPTIKDGSILAVTSKIISIFQNRIVKESEVNKDDLIKKEATWYLPRSSSKYNVSLTIRDSVLIPTAGIDESNGNGYYILWPKDIQKVTNDIRKFIKEKYHLKKIGIIITDSKTTPLRWGTTGIALSYSGFLPLKNYIGTKDIFGKEMAMTKANIADGLAASSVLAMGEGNEQTPLALIENVHFIEFIDSDPTKKELSDWKISKDDDLYTPLLNSVQWQKGDYESR